MKSGEIIYARTNAELLNALLNKNYKQWYKCTYDLDADTFIWMVNINDTFCDGHKNNFENPSTIIEQFTKSRPKNDRFYHGLNRKYRLIFEKIQSCEGRIYKFHGLFKLKNTYDNDYVRALTLVNDKYIFKGEMK